MKRTCDCSFFIIAAYKSDAFYKLNRYDPTYNGHGVKVLSVEKIDENGSMPLFCYELVFV